MQRAYQSGWALIDIHPNNFICVDENNIKMVDLEWAMEYDIPIPAFEESWDYAGAPEHLFAQMPMMPFQSYRKTWYPLVGLSHAELMARPKPMEEIKRYFCSSAVRLPKLAYRNMQQAVHVHRQRSITAQGGYLYLPLATKYQ